MAWVILKKYITHQVREKNCDDCDGESLVLSQILDKEVEDIPSLRTN